MKKYEYLLWDVDGCLLSFIAQERAALDKCFEHFHLGECTEDFKQKYSALNHTYWEKLERGEITKERLLYERFDVIFNTFGILCDGKEFDKLFQATLGETIIFNDSALELLKSLENDYTLCVVTNGTDIAQNVKLHKSGLVRVIKHIYISDRVGYQKPDKRFFDYVFNNLGCHDLSKYIIIGDSLTSDVQGGINAGIDTVWYNQFNKVNNKGIVPTYEIHNLNEIKGILCK